MNQHSIDNFHIITLHTGYAEHDGDWNWTNVRSPFARLYYVVEGEAQIVIYTSPRKDKKKVIDLRPGYLYFIPPFTMHRYVCEGHFSHYYIHVLENSREDYRYLTDYDYPHEVEAEAFDLLLFKKLCELNPFLKLEASNPALYDNHHAMMQNIKLNQQRDLWNKVESRGILYILMSRFFHFAAPKTDVKDERIIRAISYIRSNIGMLIKVTDLASLANTSKDHFIRLFSREMGETPVNFIIRQKMESAEMMLITTDMPVKSIAQALGFDDASYFNRIFKKYVGVTPQQYRKNNM